MRPHPRPLLAGGLLAAAALLATDTTMAETTSSSSASASIEIVELRPQDPAAVVPWVRDGDTAWREGEATFAVEDTEHDTGLAARGWIATDDEHLLVRLDVTDAAHVNEQSGGDIWNGDFVRISLDGRGDGAQGGRPDAAGLFGPDDASIGFALSTSGAHGWQYAGEMPDGAQALSADLLSFARDEEQKLTRYDIRIPWSRLQTRPGAFPTFGIVVQVRSVNDAADNNPIHVRWGDGANEPRPGLFKTVAIEGRPEREMAVVSPLRDTVWESSDVAEIVVAIASDEPRKITASAGSAQAHASVEPTGDGVRHFAVRYRPDATAAGDVTPLQVSVAGTDASAEVTPVVADRELARAIARVDELLATSPHPLFTRHLRSIKGMLQTEWGRLATHVRDNVALARETLSYVQDVAAGLEGPAGEWQTYLDGRLPLFMGFLSPRDNTLQWYEVILPEGWDPDRARDEQDAYPLFVELHGAGNDHPLFGLAQHAAMRHTASPKVGYHIAPFGRGNSGYRDIGEIDVWEAYRDVHETFRIDEDRRYLFGFSMGGAGTWNLGSRTPDRWAAIGILGMAPNPGTEFGLARNVSTLPIWFWHGERDQYATPARVSAWAEEVRRHGGSPEVHRSPDVGHNYLGEKQVEVYQFLRRHTRQRPERFAFVADTPEHRGVWGIEMNRDLTVSGIPSFTCQIDGQTVRIDSQGTPGLTVDIGPDGLRMTGDVTVIWNGEEAYDGPVGEPVRLGEAPRGWRGR